MSKITIESTSTLLISGFEIATRFFHEPVSVERYQRRRHEGPIYCLLIEDEAKMPDAWYRLTKEGLEIVDEVEFI